MIDRGFKHGQLVEYIGPSLFRSAAHWRGTVAVLHGGGRVSDLQGAKRRHYRADRVLVQVGTERGYRQVRPEHLKPVA